MTAERPLISIISINYNEPDLTYTFLDSVKALAYHPVEVLIIENNSDRPVSQELASRHCPGVKVIYAPFNGGFGFGNNLGIKEAKGAYIFIVNNDTELPANLLDQMLVPFEKDAAIGVVCPKIKYFEQQDIIQYAGFTPVNRYTGRNKAVAYGEKDAGQFDIPGYTHGAHGAAMMVKKEVIERTGAFYEPYFLYYEELDWSCRILKAGFRIFYQPFAFIYHKESMSVGKNSALKIFYMNRNRLLFMKRNTSTWSYSLFSFYYISIALPVHVIKYLLSGEFELLKACIRGSFKGLMMPSA